MRAANTPNGLTHKRSAEYVVRVFAANMAPPTGIEPVPAVPETAVLSIKLWRLNIQIITKRPPRRAVFDFLT